jgi:hypothetical protein
MTGSLFSDEMHKPKPFSAEVYEPEPLTADARAGSFPAEMHEREK